MKDNGSERVDCVDRKKFNYRKHIIESLSQLRKFLSCTYQESSILQETNDTISSQGHPYN